MPRIVSEFMKSLGTVLLIAIPSALCSLVSITFYGLLWGDDFGSALARAATITGWITLVCGGLLVALVVVGVVMSAMKEEAD